MFQNISEVGPVLVLLFGVLAGYRAGQLGYRPTRKKLRRSAKSTLILLGVALLGVLIVTGMSIGLATYGWIFASNRFVVALPTLYIAAIAAVVLSVPRIIGLRRSLAAADAASNEDIDGDVEDVDSAETAGSADSPVPASIRRAATDPRVVVPVQAVGIAGLIALYTLFVARPLDPYTVDVVTVNGVLLVVSGLLWLRQQRRQRKLGGAQAPNAPRLRVRLLRTAGALVVLVVVSLVGAMIAMNASKLPDEFNMAMSDNMDYGGGPTGDMPMNMNMDMGSMPMPGHTSVAALTGGDDVKGAPDDVFTLTAQKHQIRLSSGRLVDALTFNGQVPGPELRVHEGDLVQVTLVNNIPGIGVTLHWHGLDVPNAEDGVPGVTQDVVTTGHTFTYRFRVHQVGTYWYHSHEDSYEQVDRGLFGPIVVLPKNTQRDPYDLTVTVHDWKMLKANRDSRTEAHITFGDADVPANKVVPPGSKVRLRVIDAEGAAVNDEDTPTFVLDGTPFQVAAIDGTDVHQPGILQPGTRLRIGTGGRNDLTFTMPDHPVRLTNLEQPDNGLILSPDGKGTLPPPAANGPVFDPGSYGAPAPTPFNAASTFNRNFRIVLDDGPGFYNGKFEFRLTINGEVYPNTPMFMVREGDLVKMTIVGRGHTNHPFHLHGHHILVLSHNGKPTTGSPWWADTLEVRMGDVYEFAFLANNPGIWMDHCHNLQHASKGMVMHLGYEGVTEPFMAGKATGNTPEGE